MKAFIEKQLLLYGFISLLKVIDKMQETEDYEICHKILEVLQEHGKKYDWNVPTKYSNEAIIEMKIAFMTNFGLSGDIAHKNIDTYSEQIIKNIKTYSQL